MNKPVIKQSLLKGHLVKTMKYKVTALFLIIIISLFILTACGKQPGIQSATELSVAELLTLGEKFLLELDYEQAIVYFTKVIEIEPMNPRGYTGAAEAYIGSGEVEKAIAVLHDGLMVLPDDTAITIMLEELETDRQTEPGTEPEYIAPLLVPVEVRETANKIAEYLYELDFIKAWKLSADTALLSFIKEVAELDDREPGDQRFKCGNVIFSLVDPSEPDAFSHCATVVTKCDQNGDGILYLFTLNRYEEYEYPTYEVFVVSTTALHKSIHQNAYPFFSQ